MAITRRRVKPVPLKALEALTTKRLLAYRSTLYSLETLEGSDLDPFEIDQLEPGYMYFQDSSEWQNLHAMLKSVLDQPRSQSFTPRGMPDDDTVRSLERRSRMLKASLSPVDLERN